MNASQFVTPVIDRRYRWDKRNQLIERSVGYGQTGEVLPPDIGTTTVISTTHWGS